MIRGTVAILADRCKGCALCLQACPQDVLRLSDGYNSRGYHAVILVESETGKAGCTGCGVCAVICPEAVFTVYREPVRSQTQPVAVI